MASVVPRTPGAGVHAALSSVPYSWGVNAKVVTRPSGSVSVTSRPPPLRTLVVKGEPWFVTGVRVSSSWTFMLLMAMVQP